MAVRSQPPPVAALRPPDSRESVDHALEVDVSTPRIPESDRLNALLCVTKSGRPRRVTVTSTRGGLIEQPGTPENPAPLFACERREARRAALSPWPHRKIPRACAWTRSSAAATMDRGLPSLQPWRHHRGVPTAQKLPKARPAKPPDAARGRNTLRRAGLAPNPVSPPSELVAAYPRRPRPALSRSRLLE